VISLVVEMFFFHSVICLDLNRLAYVNYQFSIYSSSLVQGITMKPLVTWLKVKRAAVTELTLAEKIQNRVNIWLEVIVAHQPENQITNHTSLL
jgi:hypothetical protein